MKTTSTFPVKPAAALIALVACVAVSTPARADIYKWTDEQGKVNFSNVPPKKAEKAKNVEIVVKEAEPRPLAPAPVATPNERALLARIEMLERQLQPQPYPMQSQPYPMQPPMDPMSMSYGHYSAPPPPPGYYAGDYAQPAYYPSYVYPVAPAYAYRLYPATSYVSRPVFTSSHVGSIHGGGGHRGRR